MNASARELDEESDHEENCYEMADLQNDDIDIDDERDDGKQGKYAKDRFVEGVSFPAFEKASGLAFDSPPEVVKGPFAEANQQTPPFLGQLLHSDLRLIRNYGYVKSLSIC